MIYDNYLKQCARSELVHGVWQGWQRCKGETEEVALQGNLK